MSNMNPTVRPHIMLPTERPQVPLEEFRERLRLAQEKIQSTDLDILVVYGDREHAGDLHFLTGVDPRFEEGILLLSARGERLLLLGNECLAYGPHPDLDIPVGLFQELSPQGQIRTLPTQLDEIFAKFGMGSGTAVGVAGGKYLSPGFVREPQEAHSVPSYLIDALRHCVGAENLSNQQHLFVDAASGLRTTASVHQIAEYEFSAAVCSASVHGALDAIHVGQREWELGDNLFSRGVPWSVHTMVNFGPNVARGLSSPGDRRIVRGDAYQVAQGIRGSLNCRSGALVESADDLHGEQRGTYPALAKAYFDSLSAWYEALDVGVAAGDVYAAADTARADIFEFALNPGHLLDFEEWAVTSFEPGSTVRLRSGSVLQGDIIPVVEQENLGMNIEDGVVLADEALRTQLEMKYPEVWRRMQVRKAHVREHLGVHVADSVLFMSNAPLWHTPYGLDRTTALTK